MSRLSRLDALGVVLVLIGLMAAAFWLAGPERRLSGRVYVVDGDTLKLGAETVRLAGMDAPELAQTCHLAGRDEPCGRMAREAVIRMIAGVEVSCRIVGRDSYRRDLGHCDAGGQDIGRALVEAGLAVAYGEYRVEEALARLAGRGFWAGSFERPSDWRKAHRPPLSLLP